MPDVVACEVVWASVVRVGDLGLGVLLVEFANCCSYGMFTSCLAGGDVVTGWCGFAFGVF